MVTLCLVAEVTENPLRWQIYAYLMLLSSSHKLPPHKGLFDLKSKQKTSSWTGYLGQKEYRSGRKRKERKRQEAGGLRKSNRRWEARAQSKTQSLETQSENSLPLPVSRRCCAEGGAHVWQCLSFQRSLLPTPEHALCGDSGALALDGAHSLHGALSLWSPVSPWIPKPVTPRLEPSAGFLGGFSSGLNDSQPPLSFG